MEEKEHVVGKSMKRVDALEKVTGRARYTDDLCDKSVYIARILHAEIAHGIVKSVDTSDKILFSDSRASVVYGSCTSGCERPAASDGSCEVLWG